jgi:hypothetical protein
MPRISFASGGDTVKSILHLYLYKFIFIYIYIYI